MVLVLVWISASFGGSDRVGLDLMFVLWICLGARTVEELKTRYNPCEDGKFFSCVASLLNDGTDSKLFVPSMKTVKEARTHPDNPCGEDPAALMVWLRRRGPNGEESWLKTFDSLRQNPAAFHARKSADPAFAWDFDAICDWQRSFHFMQVIDRGIYGNEMLLALERAHVPVSSVWICRLLCGS